MLSPGPRRPGSSVAAVADAVDMTYITSQNLLRKNKPAKIKK